VTVQTCPGCHRAEPLLKTEWRSANETLGIAASVTVPINLCGRCGIRVAEAAVSAVALRVSQYRRGDYSENALDKAAKARRLE